MIALSLLFGCGPPPIGEWEGCLSEHATVVPHPRFGLVPADGTGTVVGMNVQWGGLPWLITDMEYVLDLLVALPEPIEARSYPLADLQRQMFDSVAHPVDGHLEIVSLHEDHAIVDVDLVFPDEHDVRHHLVGRARLRRGIGARCR